MTVMLAMQAGPSCSVVGMKRAPAQLEAGEYPDCTSAWTLPLADMAGAVITGSASVLLHSQASAQDNQDDDSKTFRIAGWSAAGVAAVFIASAGYGAYQRARCERLMADTVAPGSDRQWLEESKPMPGSAGATCKSDEDCDAALVCDEPMRTCVPPPGAEEE